MTSVRHSVLRVIKPDGTTEGTAFLVTPIGLAITCWHVAEKAANGARLNLQWRHPSEANCVIDIQGTIDDCQAAISASIDLVLIRIPIAKIHPDMFLLRLADWTPISGVEVESFGFPEKHPIFGLPASANYLEATSDKSRSQLYVFRSIELTGGFSGAPLVLPRTNIAIGMVDSTITPDRRDKYRDHAIALPTRLILQVANVVDKASHPLVEALRVSARLPSSARTDYDCIGIENLYAGLEPNLVIANQDLPQLNDIEKIFCRAKEKRCRLLLVTGPGGSGKSTLVKRLNADGHELFSSVCNPQTIVMLRITAFQLNVAADIANGCTDEEILWASLGRSNLLRLPFPGTAKLLREVIEDKDTVPILLIDKLDEVLGDRYEIIDKIRSLVTLIFQNGGITILASRPIRELDALKQARDEVIEISLQSVGKIELERFARSYLSSHADDFVADLTKRRWLSADATPLKVAIAAASFRNSGYIADSETELIEEYCDVLISQALDVQMKWDKESVREARALINNIAFEHIELGDSSARRFAHIIVSKLPKNESANTRRLERDILDDISELQKFSILLHGNADNLSFSHVTIRDCCAAQHLATLPLSDSIGYLSRWMDENWRTTIIYLLANRKFYDPSDKFLREAVSTASDASEEDILDFIVDCLACGLKVSSAWKANIIEECLFRAANHEDGFLAKIMNKCLEFYIKVPDDILRISRLNRSVDLTEFIRPYQHLSPRLVDYIDRAYHIRGSHV